MWVNAIDLKGKRYIGLSSGIHNPIGIRLGAMDMSYNSGVYINFQVGGTKFGLDSDLSTNDIQTFSGDDHYYKTNGETKQQSYMCNLGLTTKLIENLSIFYGLGYGNYTKTIGIDYYKLNDKVDGHFDLEDKDSVKGISSELGVQYKYSDFLISAGGSNIKFERFDVQFGVSYIF
jgi:hypothetical protein